MERNRDGWLVIDASCGFINVVCFSAHENWRNHGVVGVAHPMMRYHEGTLKAYRPT